MNHLLRDLAPLTGANWKLVEDEAIERLTPALAARRVVDFLGPYGWTYSATNLGRTRALEFSRADGVEALQRRVMPLVELRADFSISLRELRDHDRGALDPDLDDLDAAAHRIAVAENAAVVHGWSEAAIAGIAGASPHEGAQLAATVDAYTRSVAEATELLLARGIAGPYALLLSRAEYTRVIESAEHGGYPLLDHLRKILGGPIVWGPGVEGGVVLSLRGGDYRFESGQDLAVGYERHDADAVYLYLQESFSFVVETPEAAVWLAPHHASAQRSRKPPR
ncbi:MAG: family 1 encapsulin nanocompartment shell protein [Solirubrobacteraceae bacterium]|jgi:uncharacterized linocin/CFP29 family protein